MQIRGREQKCSHHTFDPIYTYKTLKPEASRHSNPTEDHNWQWKSEDCDFKFEFELHNKEKQAAEKGKKGCLAKSWPLKLLCSNLYSSIPPSIPLFYHNSKLYMLFHCVAAFMHQTLSVVVSNWSPSFLELGRGWGFCEGSLIVPQLKLSCSYAYIYTHASQHSPHIGK